MEEQSIDPRLLAHTIAVETSERSDAVGDFVEAIDLGDDVVDYRFVSTMAGYEGWQWSVTLHYDREVDRWTVNESTLLPTEQALRPPKWIPWKDRLTPEDLTVVDSIGTAEDDERLEDGFRQTAQCVETVAAQSESEQTLKQTSEEAAQSQPEKSARTHQRNQMDVSAQSGAISEEDLEEAIQHLYLDRRRVMNAEAIAQTAQRWYSAQPGPKSLSTKIADGKACASCGFMIPLAGSLGNLFGVCANQWSPDDGRVVALDHACGQHSDIEPPEPSQLWIQSAPAYDDYHIEIIQQSPREELAEVELIEEAIEDSKTTRKKKRRAA